MQMVKVSEIEVLIKPKMGTKFSKSSLGLLIIGF